MSDAPRRLDPETTDSTAAAIILRCAPGQVGPCPRCQGLTVRYGPQARLICPACSAQEAKAA